MLWTVLAGMAAGGVAGGLLWRWLRTGDYRIEEDHPRLSLARSWLVVPTAAAAGGLAGVLGDPWLAAAAWIYRGRMEVIARARSVFPAPGGPDISRLCPPEAATSSARFICSCPFISLKSVSD